MYFVFRKKCNELLEIRCPIINITVLLQLLVPAIDETVTSYFKKVASYVTE
jgi:hypothetical protein